LGSLFWLFELNLPVVGGKCFTGSTNIFTFTVKMRQSQTLLINPQTIKSRQCPVCKKGELITLIFFKGGRDSPSHSRLKSLAEKFLMAEKNNVL